MDTDHPATPPLPHELIQLTLLLAAHSLVIDTVTSTPRDFPDPHALRTLALVTPDNYTSLNQFVYLNVPWCSIHDAARCGDIGLVRWWLTKSGMHISTHQFALALFEASRAGQVGVLEFWKDEFADIEVDPRRVRHMLMGATMTGQVDVLRWWVGRGGFDPDSFGPPLRTNRNFDMEHPNEYARAAFYINCLPAVKFWVGDNKPLPEKLFQTLMFQEPFGTTGTADDLIALQWLHGHQPNVPAKLAQMDETLGVPIARLDALAGMGHVHLLQWFLDYCRTHAIQLDAMFRTSVLQAALNAGHVTVANWWRANNLPLDVAMVLSADRIESPAALSWLAASGWPFNFTENAVDLAESVARLDWWLQHCAVGKLKYTDLAMDRASDLGRVDLLGWWIHQASVHGLALKYSSQSLDLAAEAGELQVLEWWLDSELELKIHTPLACAARGNHVDVMDWLWAHDVYNKGAEEHLAIAEAVQCRNTEALEWLEARGLLASEDVVYKAGELILRQDDDEMDRYGLSWWMRKSKVLDDMAKDRLMGMWREVQRLNVYDLSDDDDAPGTNARAWQVSVEDMIPYLDIAKA